MEMKCLVCGSHEFADSKVIWPGLAQAWGLDEAELAYVNRQQGTHCVACGSNLRSIALAGAICRAIGRDSVLADIHELPGNLLEINEAGTLHATLSRMRGHVYAKYPECDMQAMAYPDGSFDFIVHSDTLEHVPDPKAALAEMHRVLTPRGKAIFTVPIIVGRMTRSRDGLEPSFHGEEGSEHDDLRVHTEFGADVWGLCLAAGFRACEFYAFEYPSAIAVLASK